MLNSVYHDAILHRDKTLSILRDSSYKEIIEKAKNNWIKYSPTNADSDIIGIDASFNSIKYQGLDLWVVTAVAVRTDNSIVCDLHKSGLGLVKDKLSSMANSMESKACENSLSDTNLILMDGSIHTKILMEIKEKNHPTIPKLFLQNSNIIFVSKTSDTRNEFKKYDSVAGDIFYYGKANKTAGYSKIYTDEKYGVHHKIISFFLRLSESQPLLKIEMFCNKCDDTMIKYLVDRMYKNSVMGYPYSLRLAHKNCKISVLDMQRFARLHGLLNETNSREVLN
ncbi:MAG: nuclease [Cenarchaeum symbiont of Oopsacas minuta]|nr:nuclease [Cenarchaeum symbiont of Oopsacas minuta]